MNKIFLLLILIFGGLVYIIFFTDKMQWLSDFFSLIMFFLGFVILAIPIVFIVFIMIAMGMWVARFVRRGNQMVDGAFPLKSYIVGRVRTWYNPFGFWTGVKVWIDPNRIVGATWIEGPSGIIEPEPGSGWSFQHAYNGLIEFTNQVRAQHAGDDSLASLFNRNKYKPIEHAKYLPPLGLPDPDNEVDGKFEVVRDDWATAVKKTDQTDIPLGMTDQNEIVLWDLISTPHIRVHGASRRAGKTNLIKTMIASAMYKNGQIVIADRRAGKDWGELDGKVQFVDTRKPGVFASLMLGIQKEYGIRDDLLAQTGVGDVAKMNNPPSRIFVVISEFGSMFRNLDKEEADFSLPILTNIVAESGATGIHLILEDQVHRDWPRTIRGNITPISGWLPKDSVLGGSYSKASELGKFCFFFEGQIFLSWDASACSFEQKFPSSQVLKLPDFQAPDLAGNMENLETFGNLTGNQRVIFEWIRDHPNGTQKQMIKDFESDGISISRGYISKMWNKYK